ncbi:MAG: Ca2+/Na+ antiporter [Motiliproteus sp.]|jgi:Ca2+/Na+ antiporter
MFIWILVVVVLTAFLVYSWAELGTHLKGRNLWLLLGWSVAALVAFQVALSTLGLSQLLCFIIFLLVLAAGHYQLRTSNPQIESPHKKSHPNKYRPKKLR